MVISVLLKNTIKKIKKSFGRYISLMMIILIGVAFYAGIKESIPDMKEVQTNYYQETNLMDIKVQGSLGLTDADVEAIRNLPEVEDAEGSYSKFVMEEDYVIKVHALTDKINGVDLIEGAYPEDDSSCLADANTYHVGDVITVREVEGENLKVHEFTVTGTIRSPLYTGTDYGDADIGNGSLTSYIFVPETVFDYDTYTEIYVTANKGDNNVPYSSAYNEAVNDAVQAIEGISSEREEARIDELLEPYQGYPEEVVEEIRSGLTSDWYLFDRDDVVTMYTTTGHEYNQLTTLSNVIPIFFIIIVVLMTSNTMSRMIVEERSEMGTFASLGITNKRIIFNYLVYVLSSTILGTVFGYLLGSIIIPQLIYICFPIDVPALSYHFRLDYFCIYLLITVTVMFLVTVYSCHRELKNKPANLLRPVSPKSGKTILLERIGFIWNHLSFSWKITLRNIFRYKKRVFMTLIGTAGCTMLIMIGFAVQDSINGVGEKQFREIHRYDNLVVLNQNVTNHEEVEPIIDGIVTNELLLNQSYYDVIKDGVDDLSVTVLISEDDSTKFEHYFDLEDNETKDNLTLTDDGVIISNKIADLFSVQAGDTISLRDSNDTVYQVKVSGVALNYVSNYIYMSKGLYESLTGDELTFNSFVSEDVLNEEEVSTELLNQDEVLSVNLASTLLAKSNGGIEGLNYIIALLVIISCLLCFAVLYNLTSINISERTREIATLKVLGFKDLETNEYIYRETLVTVFVGILLGFCMTPFLHAYLIDLLENETVTFLRTIQVTSFVWAGLLTLAFAILMQIITFFKLKRINMIESLKSVE